MADVFDDVTPSGLSQTIVRGPPRLPGRAPLRTPMLLMRCAIIVMGAAILVVNVVAVGVGLDGSVTGKTDIDTIPLYCSLPIDAVILIHTSIDLAFSKSYKRMPSQTFVLRIVVDGVLGILSIVCGIILVLVDHSSTVWRDIAVALLIVMGLMEFLVMPIIVLQAKKTSQILEHRRKVQRGIVEGKPPRWSEFDADNKPSSNPAGMHGW